MLTALRLANGCVVRVGEVCGAKGIAGEQESVGALGARDECEGCRNSGVFL